MFVVRKIAAVRPDKKQRLGSLSETKSQRFTAAGKQLMDARQQRNTRLNQTICPDMATDIQSVQSVRRQTVVVQTTQGTITDPLEVLPPDETHQQQQYSPQNGIVYEKPNTFQVKRNLKSMQR